YIHVLDPAPPEPVTLSLHDALPISSLPSGFSGRGGHGGYDIVCFVAVYFDGGDIQRVHDLFDEINLAVEFIGGFIPASFVFGIRSEEHTSELQSRFDLVCRLLLETKNTKL